LIGTPAVAEQRTRALAYKIGDGLIPMEQRLIVPLQESRQFVEPDGFFCLEMICRVGS
jgi:hypothetical protein